MSPSRMAARISEQSIRLGIENLCEEVRKENWDRKGPLLLRLMASRSSSTSYFFSGSR